MKAGRHMKHSVAVDAASVCVALLDARGLKGGAWLDAQDEE